MKKLVLVVAMFMFVCGGSFFAMAQSPVTSQATGLEMVNDTIVPDTTKADTPAVPDTTATPVQPAK